MYLCSALFVIAAGSLILGAQEQAPVPAAAPAPRAEAASPDQLVVDTGTRIPLSMINSVSTKTAVSGERVYLGGSKWCYSHRWMDEVIEGEAA